ncbi:hypothetical protein JRQ81_012134, partial [Phrynocephalus forsythii]
MILLPTRQYYVEDKKMESAGFLCPKREEVSNPPAGLQSKCREREKDSKGTKPDSPQRVSKQGDDRGVTIQAGARMMPVTTRPSLSALLCEGSAAAHESENAGGEHLRFSDPRFASW